MSRKEDDQTIAGLLTAVRQFQGCAQAWHGAQSRPAPEGSSGDIAADALYLHEMNFALWHHEDAVRRPGVADGEVACRKRSIDNLNARRNAAIEDIDVILLDHLDPDRTSNAAIHTETPGRIIDRLSVLALRLMHASSTRRAEVREQYDDLLGGLERFLDGMHNGEVTFKLYRQFKSAHERSYCALFETRDT